MSTTSTAPALFNFNGRELRQTVREDGEPMFVAKDAMEILGLSNVTEALRGLDEDERGSVILNTSGGRQEFTTITESGLYALVLKSRRPEAEAFRRWLRKEVIPAIRKTGSYTAPAGRRAIAPAMSDKTRAILSIARDLPRIFPGVRRDILAVQTLRAIEENGELKTDALRLALPAPKDEEIEKLNATQVGALSGLSSREVNKRLVTIGFQMPVARGGYEVVGDGLKHGAMYPFERNGHTGHQPLWKSSVAEFLRSGIPSGAKLAMTSE